MLGTPGASGQTNGGSLQANGTFGGQQQEPWCKSSQHGLWPNGVKEHWLSHAKPKLSIVHSWSRGSLWFTVCCSWVCCVLIELSGMDEPSPQPRSTLLQAEQSGYCLKSSWNAPWFEPITYSCRSDPRCANGFKNTVNWNWNSAKHITITSFFEPWEFSLGIYPARMSECFIQHQYCNHILCVLYIQEEHIVIMFFCRACFGFLSLIPDSKKKQCINGDTDDFWLISQWIYMDLRCLDIKYWNMSELFEAAIALTHWYTLVRSGKFSRHLCVCVFVL